MNVEVVYIYPLDGEGEWRNYACRFVASYHTFPPGYLHSTVIVCNGAPVTNSARSLFASLPKIRFFEHDNSGNDIGGFRAWAKQSRADYLMMFGACAHFKRAYWLARMVSVEQMNGAGLYGTLANNEVRPHIRTTGFFCPPVLLNQYMGSTDTKAEQYLFEHGENCITNIALRSNLKTMLVAWDKAWESHEWQSAPNSFRSGDQSNCVTFDKHTDIYENNH